MRKDIYITLSFLSSMLLGQQWTPIGPHGKTGIWALDLDPVNANTVYAGTYYSGLYRSVDSGQSWQLLGITGTIVRDIEVSASSETIVAVAGANTSKDGLYRSDDNGTSWRRIFISETFPAAMSLAILSADADTLLLGTNSGIFKSTDAGESWTKHNDGIRDNDYYFLSMEVDPADSKSIFAGSGMGLYQSKDGGLSWEVIGWFEGSYNRPAYIQDISVDPNDSEIILVATWFGGVHKTVNGGLTWEGLGHTGIQTHAVAIDPHDSDVFYAGTLDGLYRSTTSGTHWSQVLDIAVKSLALPLDSEGMIYCGSRFDGLYISEDGAENWAESNSGVISGRVSDILVPAYPESTVFFAMNGSLYYSPDLGRTWDSRGNASFLASQSDTLGTLYAVSGSVLKSDDLGLEWEVISNELPYMTPLTLAISPVSDSLMFLGATTAFEGHESGLFRSQDGGLSWAKMRAGLPEYLAVTTIVFKPNDPRTLYLGSNSGVFKSMDEGGTWEFAGQGIPDGLLVNSLSFYGDNFSSALATTSGGVYMSSNNEDWHLIGLDNQSCTDLLTVEDTVIVATRSGVLRSVYPFKKWIQLNNGLRHEWTTVIAYDRVNEYIYLGTVWGGLYRFSSKSDLDTQIDSKTTLPGLFHFDPPYPNPFNPTTTLQYDLPRSGHVSLIIYDLLGREVEVAIDSWQEAGRHSIVWDAGGVPTGIYFVRMVSGDFSQARKVMVLR